VIGNTYYWRLMKQLYKYLQFVSFFSIVLFAMFMWYQQLHGHPIEREACWRIGGILWTTMNQELICIKPENDIK